jgi:hypothetical protein
MDILKIKELQKILNTNIKNINDKIIKRDRKINFKEILYGSIYKCINNTSYQDVSSRINLDFIKRNIDTTITNTAFIKKRNNIPNEYFLDINDSFVNYIFKNDNKPRIYGVDGSFINLFKNFDKYDFMYASQNETYCQGIISCLYDIDNKIPINYFLLKTKDEREAFRNQIKYLRCGDTVIFDRGYYSYDLIEKLELLGVNYIFRLKSNKKEVQIMNKSNLNDFSFINKKINNRIVHYRIDNSKEDYYLLTNLNKSLDELKDLYWKRWQVEIHFKESKYNLSLKTINLKTENSLMQEIYIHNLIFMLYYYFKIDDENPILKSKYKINNKVGIKIFSENIIYLLIYNKITDKCFKIIKRIIEIIGKNLQYIQIIKKNNERKRIRPYAKWYFSKK